MKKENYIKLIPGLIILLIAIFLYYFFVNDLIINYYKNSSKQHNNKIDSYTDQDLENKNIIHNISANQVINSPLNINGKASGVWFFEASFPVKLYDGNGRLLVATMAQAKEDWTSEDFVPFEAKLEFLPPETGKGTLVLEKDNPSGLAENADELRMPVFFSQEDRESRGEDQEKRAVKLYYYHPELDQDEEGNIACSRKGLTAVERTIPLTETPIQDTIKLLLKGDLTEEEKARGIETEYPLAGLSLEGASLKDGVLTLAFSDPQNKTSGGSCRAGI